MVSGQHKRAIPTLFTMAGIANPDVLVMMLGSVGAVCAAIMARRTPIPSSWNAIGVPLVCAIPAASALVAWHVTSQSTGISHATPATIALGVPVLGLVIGLGMIRALGMPFVQASAGLSRRSVSVFIGSALVALVISASGEIGAIDAQLLVIGALAWFWFVQSPGLGRDEARSATPGFPMLALVFAGAVVCAIGAARSASGGAPVWAIELSLLICGIASAIIASSADRAGAWLSATATAALAIAITVALAIGSASVALIVFTARAQPEWSREGIPTALGVALFSTPRVRGLAGALPALALAIAGLAVLSHTGDAIRAKPARSAGMIVALSALGLAAFGLSKHVGLQ